MSSSIGNLDSVTEYHYKLSKNDANEGIGANKFFGVQVFQGAFVPMECAEIRALAIRFEEMTGLVSSGELKRDSKIRWLSLSRETEWIYHRLDKIVTTANRRFGFTLGGFIEPLQYSIYDIKGRLGCHTDLGEGSGRFRKVSISVQLTEASDYAGGRLRFPAIAGLDAPDTLGTTVAFPSFCAHEVTEVVAGRRESLSAWVCGPPFE